MLKKRFSRIEFEVWLNAMLSQEYPEVKYQDPDSCIADYLVKRRLLNKGKFWLGEVSGKS